MANSLENLLEELKGLRDREHFYQIQLKQTLGSDREIDNRIKLSQIENQITTIMEELSSIQGSAHYCDNLEIENRKARTKIARFISIIIAPGLIYLTVKSCQQLYSQTPEYQRYLALWKEYETAALGCCSLILFSAIGVFILYASDKKHLK